MAAGHFATSASATNHLARPGLKTPTVEATTLIIPHPHVHLFLRPRHQDNSQYRGGGKGKGFRVWEKALCLKGRLLWSPNCRLYCTRLLSDLCDRVRSGFFHVPDLAGLIMSDDKSGRSARCSCGCDRRCDKGRQSIRTAGGFSEEFWDLLDKTDSHTFGVFLLMEGCRGEGCSQNVYKS